MLKSLLIFMLLLITFELMRGKSHANDHTFETFYWKWKSLFNCNKVHYGIDDKMHMIKKRWILMKISNMATLQLFEVGPYFSWRVIPKSMRCELIPPCVILSCFARASAFSLRRLLQGRWFIENQSFYL